MRFRVFHHPVGHGPLHQAPFKNVPIENEGANRPQPFFTRPLSP